MKIFPPQLEIDEREGFAKDIFGRSKIGQGIVSLLSKVSDPLVLAVDAQWGSGKTVFLKMLSGELRKNNFSVIYFDAFEHDYVEDAFTALAGEIISIANRENSVTKKFSDKFLTTAIDAGKVLLRSGLKIGIKAATIGALSEDDVKDVVKDIGAETSAITDKYLGELLEGRNKEKEAIQTFRKCLAELPSLLRKKESNSDNSDTVRPLVFVIDELDRCRPHFALEILERIKHFFSVPNVHFILGTHMRQLENSVAAAYGPAIDSKKYLEKFVHITLMLVDTAQFENDRITKRFLDYLKIKMEFDARDERLVDGAFELIRYVSEQRVIGLRSIERIVTALAISLASTNEKYFRPSSIVAGLCVLKVIEPDLFEKAKRGSLSYAEIKVALAFAGPQKNDKKAIRSFFIDWWRFCADANADEKLIQNYSKSLFEYGIDDRETIIPSIANNVIDRFDVK